MAAEMKATAEDMKKCVWVKPELVAREDKDAHTVTKELPGEA